MIVLVLVIRVRVGERENKKGEEGRREGRKEGGRGEREEPEMRKL